MIDDIYYYKDRCGELESQLFAAQKTIDRLTRRLYDIRRAVENSRLNDGSGVLDTIAWLTYDWKD